MLFLKNKELAVFDDSLKDLKPFMRFYIGSETCMADMPNITQINRLAKSNKVTLVTPFVTDFEMLALEKIFKNVSNIEVVFNDWGVFELLKKYKKLTPVLGRFLTKQRSDPAAYPVIKNSKALIKHFGQSLVNGKIFQNFLIKNNIRRVELDVLPWKNILRLPKEIKASIYYPLAKITATRFDTGVDFKDCGIYIVTPHMVVAKANKKMLADILKNKQADRIVVNYGADLPVN
jgi:hypothetical protein